MKKTKLSEAQIVLMLNERESGVVVTDLCRKYQILIISLNLNVAVLIIPSSSG